MTTDGSFVVYLDSVKAQKIILALNSFETTTGWPSAQTMKDPMIRISHIAQGQLRPLYLICLNIVRTAISRNGGAKMQRAEKVTLF